MTPAATRPPEFPDGAVFRSSSLAWTTTEWPRMSVFPPPPIVRPGIVATATAPPAIAALASAAMFLVASFALATAVLPASFAADAPPSADDLRSLAASIALLPVASLIDEGSFDEDDDDDADEEGAV